jgi:nicotinamidase-related amidase
VLDREKTALVLIDVQEKLFRLMPDQEALVGHLQQLVRGAQVLKLPIVWAEQYPEGMGKTIQAVAELLSKHVPIPKRSFSVCGHEPLRRQIQSLGCKQFVLAGIESHVCVYQSAVDLLALGYEVEVVSDAVSSRTEANRRIGLERVRRAGAAITSVETVLFELLRVAEGPRFKEILSIVK